jgi:hypothetical protein
MRPTVDETIRFYREDGAYVLVHDGTLDGGSKLRYIIGLIERETGLKLASLGYFGQGTHSQERFRSGQPIDEHAFARRTRQLLRLPLAALAARLAAKGVLGPKPGEPALENLNEKTGAATLKEWAISYYEANEITCPGSLNVLERNRLFRWRRVPFECLRHNLQGSYEIPVKVECYRQLLEKGHPLPPLICRRRGWDLLEGYHRLRAHEKVGSETIPCVIIGRR